jgi:periplasmic protein TonB
MRWLLVLLFTVSLHQAYAQQSSCTPIETDAFFSCNPNDFHCFVERQLKTPILAAQCATPGSYPVRVLFMIDRDGRVKDVRALTRHGFGLEEEAIRAISASPRWTSGTRNGRLVREYRCFTVVFSIKGALLL